MFRNIVYSAFGAALAVGVCVSLLQAFTTTPLILHAEEYEGGQGHEHAAAVAPSLFAGWMAAYADDGEEHEEAGWAPADGFERSAYTVLANAVIGFGVALMLLGLMVAKGDPIDIKRGLLWGVAGFFAVSLLPSLGLPPELPGTPAAELTARQTWWLATAVMSAGGIALAVFGRQWWMVAVGVALVLVPHVIGAPQPASHEVPYPGGLAGQFVVASLVVSAALWTLAGAASGWLYRRLSVG
jgi:cobalt transporter subunit CbtA